MLKHLFLVCAIGFLFRTAWCQPQTVPGEIITPYPTLVNLAVEWRIQGDDNQNGRVNVSYRRKGSAVWLEGMPLRRVPAGENVNFKWMNKHAGSLFDLTPNTVYEIKLNLKDPDGGSSEKMVEMTTRAEPLIQASAEIIELTPGAYDTLFTKNGTKDRPVVYQCSQ